MVYRNKPSYAVLANLYDVIREMLKDDKYYYDPQEVEKLKKDKSITIIKRKE